jgi:hypothetical protein
MADSPGLGILANFNPEIANELPEIDIRLNSKLFRTRLWPTGNQHTRNRSTLRCGLVVNCLAARRPCEDTVGNRPSYTATAAHGVTKGVTRA